MRCIAQTAVLLLLVPVFACTPADSEYRKLVERKIEAWKERDSAMMALADAYATGKPDADLLAARDRAIQEISDIDDILERIRPHRPDANAYAKMLPDYMALVREMESLNDKVSESFRELDYTAAANNLGRLRDMRERLVRGMEKGITVQPPKPH